MYDILVIGSGPGGYVAAIRAAQLGMKVGLVEKTELGGICLNWGCIPTKALLKSAEVLKYAKQALEYGIEVSEVKPDIHKIVERSRSISSTMSKGVDYLIKKNKVELIQGFGKLIGSGKVEVSNNGNTQIVEAKNIILATGARSRELPNLPIDGEKIIGYREALIPKKVPASMVVVGSGAIGSELAYFYNAMGTQVTLIEYLPNIVPLEDEEVSAQLSRSFRKAGIKIMVNSSVTQVDTSGEQCKVTIVGKKGEEIIECETVLSAVGITANIENIGLEELGIKVEKGKIITNESFQTSISGVYAIGDIIATPALAHVASAEAINCVERIAGLKVSPINYQYIPSCIYTSPEVASVGLSEKSAKEVGKDILIGKFPFTASGKATSSGAREGFVKLVFDKQSDKLLGASLIGNNVTEMISELTLACEKGITAKDIIGTIHPHPTMNESIMEAAAAAHNEVIHL